MEEFLTPMFEHDPALECCRTQIEEAYTLLLESILKDGKILTCGNGGSAADSDHIVGELMKGFLLKRPVDGVLRMNLQKAYGETGTVLADHLQGAIPAISLVSQTALITAFLNDVDPAMIFAQQVLGYGRTGDCLIALSTSGNAANVVNAVRVAKVLGMRSIGFTASGGGELANLCDVCIRVPAQTTARAQEYHIMIYHALCAALETAIFTR